MRIAFVDNLSVAGGLSRFSLLLSKSLLERDPSISIDYFIHFNNLRHIPEIRNVSPRLNVFILQTTRPKGIFSRLTERVLSKLGNNRKNDDPATTEIEKRIGKEYDLAYFPSAHMMKRPTIGIPVVGTLHDFNWKYFFGREIFPTSFVEMMDEEIMVWMEKGHTICSSRDVVDEAHKLYPAGKNYPEVVPIAPVIYDSQISDVEAAAILKELGIDFPYIIFPGNFYPHKNHLNLFTAFSLLRKRKGFESYKLILTGMNSQQVKRGIAGYRGVELLTKNGAGRDFDVMGMGYQPNKVIDSLISRARLLVSPSIYEAICTPAMDAWHFGTPTAISDIPPFREHEKTWSIKSAFFDPMDPENIADVLEAYLNQYDKAREDGRVSKENMARYTWDNVASRYLDVFRRAIKEHQ